MSSEELIEDDDGVGNDDDAVVIRVRRVGARDGLRAREEEVEDRDGVRNVDRMISVRVSPDEKGDVVDDREDPGHFAGQDARETRLAFVRQAGAFTGAEVATPGILESLSAGTLLLDEVGELPPGAQAKLLKALESKSVRRVGSTEERPIDVRFLAATSKDLRAAVEARTFRKDFYFRISRLEVRAPPLRERRDDIPLLAQHFLELHARQLERPAPALEESAVRALIQAPWPGNVRELESVLLQALITLGRGESLGAATLRPFLREDSAASEIGIFREDQIEGRGLDELKRELERAYMIRLFRDVQGDLGKMMKTLEVKQSYFYTWLRRLKIDVRGLRKAMGFPRRRG